MRVNAAKLLTHIERASVKGVINEAVFGNHLSFAAADESKTVVTISNGIYEGENSEIGIYNLKLFAGMVKKMKKTLGVDSKDIEMNIVDNKLVFGDGCSDYKFLTSNPKVISSVVGNTDELIEKVTVGDATVTVLSKATRDACLDAINLIEPNICTFSVDFGNISLLVGDEIKHTVKINLGSTQGQNKFRLVVKPPYLLRILSVLRTDKKDVTLELYNAMPPIFRIEGYTFLLASMEVE